MIIKYGTVRRHFLFELATSVHDLSTQRLKSFDVRKECSLYVNKAYDRRFWYTLGNHPISMLLIVMDRVSIRSVIVNSISFFKKAIQHILQL